MWTTTKTTIPFLVLMLVIGCGQPATQTEAGQEFEPLMAFEGTAGAHKSDAPHAVSSWEILRANPNTLVLQALDSDDRVYLEAWIEEQGSVQRVDFVEPVQCSITTETRLGVVLDNNCTLEDTTLLSISALDFLSDLDGSDHALQSAAQKADGGGKICAAASVVVGGLTGLLTTFAIFHASIIETIGVVMLAGPLTISAAGVAMGSAVFAVAAIGTAWGIDTACRHFFDVGPSSTLAQCVAECGVDDAECVSTCVQVAASVEGAAAGRDECVDACTGADCANGCMTAYADLNTLRQTLLVQCAMGCEDDSDRCAEACIEGVNIALPH